MSANLDLLRKGYDDVARGDIEAATQTWPDDFVLEGLAEGVVIAGVHKGKDAALRALNDLSETYDEAATTVDEIVGDGDTIVVLARMHAAKDGRSATFRVVHIWRFSDGQPRRMEIILDTLQSARVLGMV